jgi:hypothetical protein
VRCQAAALPACPWVTRRSSCAQFNSTSGGIGRGAGLNVDSITPVPNNCYSCNRNPYYDGLYKPFTLTISTNSLTMSTTIISRQTAMQLVSAILGAVSGALGAFAFLFPKLEAAWPVVGAKLIALGTKLRGARAADSGPDSKLGGSGGPPSEVEMGNFAVANPMRRVPEGQ